MCWLVTYGERWSCISAAPTAERRRTMPRILARASVFALRWKICAMSRSLTSGNPSRSLLDAIGSPPGVSQRATKLTAKTHDYKQEQRIRPTPELRKSRKKSGQPAIFDFPVTKVSAETPRHHLRSGLHPSYWVGSVLSTCGTAAFGCALQNSPAREAAPHRR